MPRPPVHAVELLKADRGCAVWLTEHPGGEMRVLKIWRLTPLRLVKLMLGIAQPQRQLRGARRLARAGVATPQPRGGLRLAFQGVVPRVSVQLDYAPGRNAWEWLREGVDGEWQTALTAAREIGLIVARTANAGLFNRDLKLENLVIGDREDEIRVSVIDPVGVRPMRDAAAETARMMERLAVQPARFGVPVPAALTIRCLRAALSSLAPQERRGVIRRLRSRPEP